MTTRINVNVDQQALLQRSREQTQANRLAFLEGQNRSRVGKEAERQRNANRAARGLTADGSMYNNRLRQLPQRPEPAAWRVGDLLRYFWFNSSYEIIGGLSYRRFRLAPGTGDTPLTISYTNPTLVTQLDAQRSPHQEPTTHIPGGPGLALNSATEGGNTKTWRYRDLSCTPVGSVELENPKYPGFMQPPTLPRDIYEQEQVVVSQAIPVSTYEHILFLPLNGSEVLFVAYRHEVGAEINTTVRERRRQTPYRLQVGVVNELIVNYSFSSQEGYGSSSTVNEKEQEDIVCARISHTGVQEVAPPSALLDRLREKRGTTALGTEERSYTRFFGNSNATIGFVCFYQGTYNPLNNVFDAYSDFIPYTETAPVRSNAQQLGLAPYGIFYEGQVVPSNCATPISWYDLDRTDSVLPSTHEQYQALSTPNITATVGSVLKARSCLGQGNPWFNDDIANGLTTQVKYRRAKSSLSGSAYARNYPYSNSTLWSDPTLRLKQGWLGEAPFAGAQPYLIYDWEQPRFCREQAGFYGIS